MTSQRITGSVVRMGVVDVPADPGWSQPDRHRSTSPGGGIDRDNAPSGGGWAPAAWGELPPVLTGETYPGGATGHRRFATHDGTMGRGDPDTRPVVRQTDAVTTGDAAGPLYGNGGAAHDGISPQGVSAPWAYPAGARRRADGGMVVRDGSLDLGKRHIHVSDQHRQGLHMNRPTIRYVRTTSPVVERSSPFPTGNHGAPRTSPFNPIARARTVGPIPTRTRRLMRPTGQTDYVDIDVDPSGVDDYDPGVVTGDGWVL